MAKVECRGCTNSFSDWNMLAPPWDVMVRDALICETCWLQWVDGEREISGWPHMDSDSIDPELRELAKNVIIKKQAEYSQGYLEELMAEDTTTAY